MLFKNIENKYIIAAILTKIYFISATMQVSNVLTILLSNLHPQSTMKMK